MSPSAARAAVFLFDDAERATMGTGDNGDWITGFPGVTYSGLQSHSGLYSYAATTTGSDASDYQGFTAGSSDPLFLKFWVYLPAAYSLGPGSAARIGGLLSTSSWATYTVCITNSAGTIHLAAGGVNGTHVVSRGAWHSVEMRYARSAGAVTVWLDGASDIALTGLTLEAKNNVLIGIGGGSGTIYLDDISVSDTASGSPTAAITAVRHAYPGARIRMKIQTYLWGAAATDSLVSSIDGTAFSAIPNPGTYQAPVLNVSALSAGSHSLQVQLQNNGGTARATWTETITASGTFPAVGIDENNNLISGGHKIFPVTEWLMHSADILAWSSAGYINTHGWGPDYSTTYNVAEYQSFLESGIHCLSTGLKAIGPGGRVGGEADQASSMALYASTLSNHPCVLMWFGFDEASVNGFTASQMQAVQTVVHSNDANHPFGYDDASFPVLNLSWYYPSLVADVYSSDNYPLTYAYAYAAQGRTFADWVGMMDRDGRANYGLTPNFIVLELYKEYNAASHWDGTNITAATVYNEAWLSVIHGRKGVSWYDNGSASNGYGPVCASDSSTSCFPANPSFHIGKFVSQVARITPDSLLAGSGTRTVASNQTAPGSRVDVSVADDGTYTWVFSARLTDIIRDPSEATAAPLSTTITVSGFGNGIASVFDESRTLPVTNGAITDTFGPYQVHIYKFADATGPAAPTNVTAIPR